MLRWLVVLALFLVPCAHAQESAREMLQRCAQTASAEREGLQQLAEACPGLESALESLGLATALAQGSAERLKRASLDELLELSRAARSRAPDTAALTPLLREMQGSAAPQSRWERFKRWVSDRLAARGANGLPWLKPWLERLTPGKLVLRLLVYTLMLGIVIAAAWIVVRELRAAGVRLPRRRVIGVPDAPNTPASQPGLEALRALPLAQRPAFLFRLVLARGVASGLLPADRSLTHRELTRALPVAATDRSTWNGLANLAERQLFARDARPDEEDARLLAAAEGLWLGAPPPPAGRGETAA